MNLYPNPNCPLNWERNAEAGSAAPSGPAAPETSSSPRQGQLPISSYARNGLTTLAAEDFDTDAMRGSMQQMLSENLGLYVICEFLVGTQAMTRKEGVLFNVGRSYLTLYEEDSQDFVVCDIFSLKFVTFYMPGQRPGQTVPNFPTVNIPGLGRFPVSPYGLGTGDTRPTVGSPAAPAQN